MLVLDMLVCLNHVTIVLCRKQQVISTQSSGQTIELRIRPREGERRRLSANKNGKAAQENIRRKNGKVVVRAWFANSPSKFSAKLLKLHAIKI
jgi:hypothetical protein